MEARGKQMRHGKPSPKKMPQAFYHARQAMVSTGNQSTKENNAGLRLK